MKWSEGAKDLWFVPDERQSDALVRERVSRGRVWTAGELLSVVPVASRDFVRPITIAKLTVDGDIVEVRRRRSRIGPTIRHGTKPTAGGPVYPPQRRDAS